jgi:hypothetical protein
VRKLSVETPLKEIREITVRGNFTFNPKERHKEADMKDLTNKTLMKALMELKALKELKLVYRKWQTSNRASDYDKFIRVCEKNLK